MIMKTDTKEFFQNLTAPKPSPGPQLATPHVREVRSTRVGDEVQHKLIYHENELSAQARTVVEKIRVLRRYTGQTGFKTTRSQNDLLQTLDGNDLANALLVLNAQ
jgi:hypothetical protein